MNIGLIGFGGVGKSFIELINNKKDTLNDLNIKYIIKSNGGISSKEGIDLEEIVLFIKTNKCLEEHKLWNNITIDNIIKNKDIDCLIELTT